MCSKVGFIGIKLDMSKAYNRVQWCFLDAVMRRMGFVERWVQLIMECVRSISYAVLINGKEVGGIQPTRGLQQGDPLFSYLFLFCAEALSSLPKQAELNVSVNGVPTSKHGPRISHLFFADDSLLFRKANPVEWCRLLNILDKYEAASDQKLNMAKTSIFFSCNTSEVKRHEITSLSGLRATFRDAPTMVFLWLGVHTA
jgi:hypothetical protein